MRPSCLASAASGTAEDRRRAARAAVRWSAALNFLGGGGDTVPCADSEGGWD